MREFFRSIASMLGGCLLSCLPAFTAHAFTDTSGFTALLFRGDSVYSQKQGYSSFLKSLRYFDSAQVIADRSGNAYLLGEATFAKGRVYDAWNKEPARTIELFQQATDLFRRAGDERRYFYTKHLVAHAYDKVGDSLRATAVLRELIRELGLKDSTVRRSLGFIPEMALIATEVRAYPLADSILKQLTHRSWIRNDPETYNYLDHYFLTRSRLDILWRRKSGTPYLDSLAGSYTALTALFDRLYYASQLADLYARTGNFPEAYRYRSIQQDLQAALNADKDFERMQRALVESETAYERRKADYESEISEARAHALWGLSLLLAVITFLSIYLYRRNKVYRAQSRSLQALNARLDAEVTKVEVLNKEIQHRIKNNLYTIYSLLQMQQDSTDNDEVIAHLEAARMRVESVAALHDHLLGSGDAVDFGAYIKVLINKVVTCFSERRRVVTHIRTAPVSLPLNTCFALSLILNEWITNSIKYAAAPGEVLNMDVSIEVMGDVVCIDYSDDGIPAAISGKQGLGTEIVRLLVAQVKGRLTQVDGRAYHYNLCIPNGKPD